MYLGHMPALFPAARPDVAVKYRPDIDGLRAVAVIAVLLFHLQLGLNGGFVGVDVFFVISGFLITHIIINDLQTGQWSLSHFWDRRLRRIWPASLLMTAVTLAGGWFLMLPRDYRALANDALASLAMLANVRFWLGSGYFAEASELRPLMHMWSLAVEEQFYLIFPIILPVAWPLGRQRCFQLTCAAAAVSFLASVLTLSAAPAATFFLIPFRAWELLVGAAIALEPSLTVRSEASSNILHAAGLILIVVCCLTYGPTTPFPAANAIIPTAGAALVIIAGRSHSGRLAMILSALPLRYIGLISYSLYLWHWPIIAFCRYVNREISTQAALAILPATLLLAALSHRFIEVPFRKMHPTAGLARTVRRIAVPSAAIAIAAIGIRMLNGVPARVSKEIAQYLAPQSGGAWSEDVRHKDQPHALFGSTQTGSRGFCVLFWGDSHGMAIIEAVDHAARARGIAGVCALQSATLPLPQLAIVGQVPSQSPNPPARVLGKPILDWIHDSKPAHVVLCARWTAYAHSFDKEGELPQPWVDTSADSDEARLYILRQRLELLVRQCADAGSTLWILLEVPYQEQTPQRRAIDSLHRGTQIDHVGVDLATHSQKQSRIRELFRTYAPLANVIDLASPFFGDDGFSRTGTGATRWYDDHTHISPEGVRAVLTPTIDHMLETIALDCRSHHGL